MPDTQRLETLSQGSELQMILLPFLEEVQALETALDALESHAERGMTQELEKVLRMLGDFMDFYGDTWEIHLSSPVAGNRVI